MAIIAGTVLSTSCGAGEHCAQAQKGPPDAPVVVAEVLSQPVPLEIHAIGNVEANSTVEVKSQVAGQLMRALFTEGQDVERGMLLFEIDPRTFQQAVNEAEAALLNAKAAVGQAEANYQRDLAQARNARSQAQRYAGLASSGIISREANENYQTQAETAARIAAASEATIASAKAGVQGAEARLADAHLGLSYTSIRAPVSGKIGRLAVKPGNLVAANAATPLVVIEQIAPAYAYFSVPEQALNDIRRYSGRSTLQVEATPAAAEAVASEAQVARGALDFLDNRVDPSTATVQLRALFPNKDRHLWPGQFVNVVVRLDVPTATVVPTAAVSTSQNGQYVFVVKPDLTAEQRTVQTAREYRDLTVILGGVQPGERVVVRGQLRLRQGVKVKILPGEQAAPQQSAKATSGTS